MSDIDFDTAKPPYVDDGQDINLPLPAVYSKNGDLFVNVSFASGQSVINQNVLNGFKING